MADLIDRQMAIEAVMFGSLGSSTVYGRSEQGMAAQKDTLLAIRMLSSVDAVEVVRCKDCYHYDAVTRRCFMSFLGGYEPTDFCSYGERADG